MNSQPSSSLVAAVNEIQAVFAKYDLCGTAAIATADGQGCQFTELERPWFAIQVENSETGTVFTFNTKDGDALNLTAAAVIGLRNMLALQSRQFEALSKAIGQLDPQYLHTMKELKPIA